MPPRIHQSSPFSLRSNKSVFFLLVILVSGFLIRIHFAPSAAHSDTIAVRSWMESSVKLGLVHSYSEQISTGWLPNYPPLSIMILEVTGYAYKWLISTDYIVKDPIHMVFAKMPAVLSDILSSLILFFIVRRLKNEKAGLLAASLYLLHPAILWNSTLWGQTDSLYTVFILASFYTMTRKHHEVGTVLIILACLVKVQAVLFLPLVLSMLPWDKKIIARSFFFSFFSVGLILSPFLLQGSFQKVIQSYFVFDVLRESHLSWNAFNIWWAIYWPHAWDMRGTDTFFSIVSFNTFAIIAFGVAYCTLLVLWKSGLRSPRNDNERIISLFLVASLIAFTSFMIGTQIHERYLFPFIACVVPLLFFHWKFIVLYIGISLVYLLNVASSFHYSQLDISLFERFPRLSLSLAILQTVFFLLFWITALGYRHHEMKKLRVRRDSNTLTWRRRIDFCVSWTQRFSPIVLLCCILFLGLSLRLSLFTMEGYAFDTDLYKEWSISAAHFGPSDSYTEQLHDNMKPDYPPFSMLMFWTIGKTASVIPACERHSLCMHLLVKLPAILADLLTVILLYCFLVTIVGTTRALLAAAIYAFHPVVFYVSAVWGQTDSVYTMLMVATLILCIERQWFFAGAYAALAITTKMQAIIIFPLLPFLLPPHRKAWIESIGGFFLMLAIILLPFATSPHGLEHVKDMYMSSIGRYAVVSANGYNFWWALLSGDASGRSSMDMLLWPFTYRMAAASLVGFFYCFILTVLFRSYRNERSKRDRAAAVFLAASGLALSFFLFNTEMHERYSFPVIALLLPVLFLQRGYVGLFVTASTVIFINILGVLSMSPVDRWLFSTFPNFRPASATILVSVFFLLLGKIWKDAHQWAPSSLPWKKRPLLPPKKKAGNKKKR